MFFTDGKLRGLEKFMSLPRYPTRKGGGRYSKSNNYKTKKRRIKSRKAVKVYLKIIFLFQI